METSGKQESVALTIAGSDPSGGAGIQADLKTFTSIGVYGGAVISCITVQNTKGVFGIHPVEANWVRKQIDHVLSDLNVTHIKIGMLGSAEVTESIYEALKDYTGEIIYDPVLESSSGQKLIEPEGYNLICNKLLTLCTAITPNVPELSILSGKNCSTLDNLQGGAIHLFNQYKKLRLIILTGGHFEPEKDVITDFMLKTPGLDQKNDLLGVCHPRIVSGNTHGTGCTFSAAFTAYHLLTGNDNTAFNKAVSYMDKLLRKSNTAAIGHGTGPLMHHLKIV
ncbi:MAG: bifunctional hydroxymethylpyrimidine kinase/phosphomethylpyrimidine kinase [Deltaproteobacteria bacterium]|jgi:hydroxymethylpyrimidine/phosphomethylpyrimidine kinase|nr:bifunctional hydroxymethylpyrimidine kinase/phosphomethylpyrimidine kinase [Deltaproteobacteria bacterium]